MLAEYNYFHDNGIIGLICSDRIDRESFEESATMSETNKAREGSVGGEIVDIPEAAISSHNPETEAKKRRRRVNASAHEDRAGDPQNRRSSAPAKSSNLAYIQDDMFLEEWDAPAPKKKKRKKKKSRGMDAQALAVNLLLVTGIFAVLALGGLMARKHQSFEAMKQAVEAQTFYEGTTVDGVDVSGKTLSAALNHWQKRIEPTFAGRTVTIDGKGAVTAQALGYQSDYESVLNNAWSAGRRGSLEQRYRAVMSRQYHPVAYQVTRTLYSEAALDACVQAIEAKIDTPARDAAIASFDVNQYAFVFTDSAEGRGLDAEGLKQAIGAALKAGGGTVEPVVETVQPAITTADVASKYGMVTSAVTNASSSSSNRLKNIERAIELINGYCLKPGETFSFNDVVGQRTTDRGFRVATAYSGGDVTEEVGGGICQVSTTLFNAAVKADLEIVERHNHSLTVGYVDKGKDATVNWKSQDLKFRNTSQDDIYICCFLSDDKRVRFGLFGRLLENGETITLEGVVKETIKFDTKYVPSAFLAPGQTEVTSQGKNGYKAEAYKIRWDAAGNEISKELLCKSYYRAKDEVIQYGA